MKEKRIFGIIESASGFTKAQQLKVAVSLFVLLVSIPLTTYLGALKYQQLRVKAANYYSTLLLVPVTPGNLYPGNNFSVEVNLNTGQAGSSPVAIDAADVILRYDNTKFTATHITPGTIFKTYIGKSYGGSLDSTAIDQTSGTITLSGLAFDDTPGAEQPTTPFAGTGVFATISFQVKSGLTSASDSEIYFDWGLKSSTCTSGDLEARKACTTDTNVVQHGTAAEVLNDAQPTTIHIAFVCANGQTRACTATNGCQGTQTCANQAWGTCTTSLQRCPDPGVVCLANCGACVPGTGGTCTATNGCSGTRTCQTNRTWGTCTSALTKCSDEVCRADCGVCTSGQTQACTASNGCPGSQACTADRQWGTCETTLSYCPADKTCQVDCGECVPSATRACETADHFAGTETCGTNRHWSGTCVPGPNCAAGYTKCGDGKCKVSCAECTAGETRSCNGSDTWGTFVGGAEVCGADSQWAGVCTRKRGDFNGDGAVNSFDLATLFNEWNVGASKPSVCDIHPVPGDGRVNSFDLAVFWTLW